MKRIVVNCLAFIGALALYNVGVGQLIRWSYDGATGVVMGPDDRPAANVPVFLDARNGYIERFLTDSAGRFTLPVEYENVERAVWMICVPGGIPMVGRRSRNLIGPTTYGYTALPPGELWSARNRGWSGPIPRGCAADSTYRWRLPPGVGNHPYASTRVEPDWDSYRKR